MTKLTSTRSISSGRVEMITAEDFFKKDTFASDKLLVKIAEACGIKEVPTFTLEVKGTKFTKVNVIELDKLLF